jgi:TPR repeat protein
LWYASAQSDPLTERERIDLGLATNSNFFSWFGKPSGCDNAAASFYDPKRKAPGIAQGMIVADVAIASCEKELKTSVSSPRLHYQMGRALLAGRDFKGASQQLENAVSAGYAAARIDLADLLLDSTAGVFDPKRAILLYEQAWESGLTIAAFKLGTAFERGVVASDQPNIATLRTDLPTAWRWYQKGADAGEPHALARFAARDESYSLAEPDPPKRKALLLNAFRLYATSAAHAARDEWPDDAWSSWRYHRATLSRLLAREDMMQQAADDYGDVLAHAGTRRASAWEVLKAAFHR